MERKILLAVLIAVLIPLATFNLFAISIRHFLGVSNVAISLFPGQELDKEWFEIHKNAEKLLAKYCQRVEKGFFKVDNIKVSLDNNYYIVECGEKELHFSTKLFSIAIDGKENSLSPLYVVILN